MPIPSSVSNPTRLIFGGVGLVSLLLAACSGASDDSGDGSSSAATASTLGSPPPATEVLPETTEAAPETTEAAPQTTEQTPPTTEAAPETTEPIQEATWTQIDPGDDCMCSDGSEYALFDRAADPTKVVLWFDGGGACFNAGTCSFTDGTYVPTMGVSPENLQDRDGVFDANNAENPLANHSFVVVPYCTGDVHIGNATTEYSDDITIEHNGFVNATAGLEHVLASYPDVDQLVVAGASAGSVPTPLMAGLAADQLDGVDILTFGDSSGAYPDVPGINVLLGDLWGTSSVIPDWPVNEGMTPEEWSFPGLYVQAGLHAPEIRFARFDFAYDGVQASFGALAGIAAADLVTLIDETEAQVEASGSNLASYVAPGSVHTIATSGDFYEMEVEGVRLADWLARHVAGDTPDDVHCVECEGS